MLRSILVGLDESPYSAAATELGLSWARSFDCLLVGVGVVDEPTLRGPRPDTEMAASYRAAYDQLVNDARRRVEQLLDRFAHRAAEMQVACKLLEDTGLPCEQIMREAERYDLVLLGTHTYFHFETSSRTCETLERVLRNAPRPIVTVPRAPRSGQSVLIAYDSSPHAARSVQAFQASGLAGLGEVRVLSIDPVSRIEAARTAGRAVEFLASHDIRAVACPLVSDDPAGPTIVQQIHQHDAQLAVMGAFGHSPIRQWFMGSVTRTVLENTDVPLFLCH